MVNDVFYPVQMSSYELVSEIEIGKCYPVYPDSYGMGACDTCKDPQGLIWWIKIGTKGPVKFLTDELGGVRQVHASLHNAPCSTCQPHKATPTQEEYEKEDEVEEEWWNV